MAVTCDPAKRDGTLRERGLDFEHAEEVFAGRTFDSKDERRNYGEVRIIITIGFLRDRMVVPVWTPRGSSRHVISMRKADEREKTRFAEQLRTYEKRLEDD